MRLPQPMLAQSGQASVLQAPGYAHEVKWDGFRAIVGLNGDLRVRSRRGWDMTDLVPELASIPAEGVFDGELVAFDETGKPSWPLLCRRILHRERDIPITFVLFDVLVHQSDNVMSLPYTERRQLLDSLGLGGSYWETPPAFDDGEALFVAVCKHELEGVVAKKLNDRYRPGERGWTKVKNRSYWRYPYEVERARVERQRQSRRC
jgi:bifunctional non-homologous end joining protein LigD